MEPDVEGRASSFFVPLRPGGPIKEERDASMTDLSNRSATSQLGDDHGRDGRGNESLTLSVTEAASLLGISRALTYELAARGEIPSIHLGRRVVIPRRALVSMIERVE